MGFECPLAPPPPPPHSPPPPPLPPISASLPGMVRTSPPLFPPPPSHSHATARGPGRSCSPPAHGIEEDEELKNSAQRMFPCRTQPHFDSAPSPRLGLRFCQRSPGPGPSRPSGSLHAARHWDADSSRVRMARTRCSQGSSHPPPRPRPSPRLLVVKCVAGGRRHLCHWRSVPAGNRIDGS